MEACQENTTVCGSYNQAMPTGLAWHFHHWIYRGTAYIDDYREFSTTGLTWTPDERMTFSYDALDRLLVSQPAAEPGAQGYTQSFAYTEIGNFLAKNGVTQNYYDPAHKHAVTHLNDVQRFWYDANGNMTRRDEHARFSSPFPP